MASGEVVFNTVLSGYQEVITDPSYAGQIISFTYPHIGNYGATRLDEESRSPFCRGVVVRDFTDRPSSWRSDESLDEFLVRTGVAGISGIDTRRLTRHIREAGAMPGAFGTASEPELLAAAQAEPGTDGIDLVATVTCDAPYTIGTGPFRVVAYDFGIKATMLAPARSSSRRSKSSLRRTSASDVLAREPDGVFLSNGPGDPATLGYAVRNIEALLGDVPVFGICLGHQLLGAALGARTFKLPFGHHGGNHPVRHLATGQVEITSQNHNFAVDAEGLDVADITHVNLNDGVVEGIRCREVPAFSVQYHPEAGPRAARRALPVRRVPQADGRGTLMPRRTDLETILIIGSGPIVIGQACEFDYSGTQACRVLRSEGYRIVLANSNPATIMTDPEFADRTYIEPLTPEVLTKIIERERPDAVLPTLGGQTALNLAMALAERGVVGNRGENSVELIGANAEAIATAEDRERFKQAMIEIGLAVPASGTARIT